MSRYTPGCGKRIAEKKTLNRWNEVHATIAYNIMQKRTVYARNHHFVAKFNSGKRDEHCIALRTQSTIIPFFFYTISFSSHYAATIIRCREISNSLVTRLESDTRCRYPIPSLFFFLCTWIIN